MTTVAITGTIDAGGGFRPGWWGSTADPVTPAPTAGRASPDWSAAALDSDGRVLAVARATLSVLPCGGDGQARLDVALPLSDGAAAVVIRHGDVDMYRRAVPPPAGVHLDFGDTGLTKLHRRPMEVAVRITAPIGPGAHLIGVWESPSHPATPLGLINVGAGQPPVVTVDLGALPGGQGCRLRVVYSDGVRTTTVVSPELDVEPRPAQPVIEAPPADHRMSADGWLSLRGRLDGDGNPEELEWFLDDAPIGRGSRAGHARPGVGAHTLTLRHGDMTASLTVTVDAVPAPLVPAPWQPPWRTRPLTVIGTPPPSTEFGRRRDR